MLGLSTPWYIAFGALSLFGALVVARFSIALARHAGSLVRSVARANEALQHAAADITDEVTQAQQAAGRISEKRRKRPRARG